MRTHNSKQESRALAAQRRQQTSSVVRSVLLIGSLVAAGALFWKMGYWPGAETPVAKVLENVSLQPTAVQTQVEGVDKSNLPFKITASKATQNQTSEKTVDLEQVTGQFSQNAADKLDVTSNKAAYDTKGKTMELEGQVVIRSADGMTATMEKASVDVNTRQLRSKSPVKVIMDTGEVTADTLEVDNNGETIKFKGRVRATFGGDPK